METYSQLDDHNSFEPIKISGAVDNGDITKTEITYGKLAMVLTYHTTYIDKIGKKSLLLIGLSNSVSVNTLIRLPTFCSLKLFLIACNILCF